MNSARYKDGIRDLRYKTVPSSWRKGVDVRNIKNKKSPITPMVLDLLAGKTIFAYSESHRSAFGSLYATAANNNKTLRVYHYDDIDDEAYKGYLMWMEDRRA